MEDYQKAELDYLNGMKYKEIAEKYNKSINTIKSWKKRHGWSKDKDGVELKRVQPNAKRVQPDAQGLHTKKFVDEQIELSNSSGLSEREEMFCINYSKYPNQTKAYMKAYNNNNYGTAQTGAWGLMRKPKILNRIRELKKGAQETALIELADIVNELKRQAFADVTDYIDYGTEKVYEFERKYDEYGSFEEVPRIDPNTGEQTFHYKNTVHFKEVEETDTSLLKSVKLNKEGHVEVETYDKQKALLELMKFMNDKTMQGARLQKLQADTEISQGKAKLMAGSDDKVMDAVANLMDAFRGAAEDSQDD